MRDGWTSIRVLGGLGLALVALVALVAWQLRARSPLVDLRLFADRAFSAANLVSLLTGYTLATAIIGGPVFVNRVLFGSDTQSATALTALTVAIAGGALVGGALSAWLGERLVTVAGVAVSVAGLWLALGWGVDRYRSSGSCGISRSSAPDSASPSRLAPPRRSRRPAPAPTGSPARCSR